MKILHVIDSLDPRCGGPPAVVLRLAAAQRLLGHKVSILTYASPGADRRIADSLKGIPGIDEVPVHSLDRESNFVSRLIGLSAVRWMAANVRNWNVLHIHGVWDPVVRASASAARRQRVPYVMVPHASLDPWAMRQTPGKRLKKALAMTVQIRGLLNDTAFVHSLNNAESAGIRAAGVTAALEIIPNGIFLEEISNKPAPGCFRAKFPELGSKPFILFLSRLHFKKGLDHLVAGFAMAHNLVPALQLVIAGPDEGERARVCADAAARGLSRDVHIVGPLYGVEKYEALVDACAFCLPSRMEGFSIAILEALAFECTVIISPQCNFPEVAANNAGLEVPLETSAIGEAMARLANNDDLRSRLAQRGGDLVRQNYTWAVIAEQTLTRYRQHGIGERT